MKVQVYAVLVSILGGALAAQGSSFTITPTFDNSIALDPNSVAIETAINNAIAVFEADFSNPIDVPIYFQAGGGLGQSNFGLYASSYSLFHSALTTTNANPAAIAALDANNGAGTNNPVNGTSSIEMKSANSRALDPMLTGLGIAPGCMLTPGVSVPQQCGGVTGPAYDGIISLNTSITSPPNSLSGSTYDLTAVAEHEIDEILGLGSGLENVSSSSSGTYSTTFFGDPTPEDLFRYDAISGGARTLSTNCANPTLAFFSYGPSTGAIAQFNNECNGGDFGDWCSDGSCPGFAIQVQNAFGAPGTSPTLGSSEIAALSAIGYVQTSQTVAPEPALFLPVAFALGLAIYRSRCLQAKKA